MKDHKQSAANEKTSFPIPHSDAETAAILAHAFGDGLHTGGFFAVSLTANGLIPQYIGEGYLRLCRMRYNQASNLFFAGHFAEVAEQDRARVQHTVQSLKHDGDFFDLSYRLLCGDGSIVTVRTRGMLCLCGTEYLLCAVCIPLQG